MDDTGLFRENYLFQVDAAFRHGINAASPLSAFDDLEMWQSAKNDNEEDDE